MASYDDWKTRGSNPGTGHGETPTYRVRCLDCAWAFTGRGTLAATTAVGQGDAHHQETGHAIVGRHGVIQARWTRTATAQRGAA